MLKIDTLIRQFDIIPMEVLNTSVTVIGCGAIGSHTAKALAQMGFENLLLIDDDVVEAENLNAQGFALSHLGKPKVECLAQIIEEYTGHKVRAERRLYEKGIFPGIVISAVDNMITRRAIWDSHEGRAMETLAVIDPRMGSEQALLYTMNPMSPEDMKTYPKTLYTDDEALREPCTRKATIYTALLLSGMVCKALKDVLTKDTARFPRIVTWSIRDNEMEVLGPKPVTLVENTPPEAA